MPSADDPLVQLPATRAQHFIGRDEDLAHLRNALTGSDAAGRIQVLHGLGGVGKTQLALQYAHRNVGDYAIVAWLPAADSAALALAYADLGKALGCRFAADATVDYVRHVTRRMLGEQRAEAGKAAFLLIFDNAEDPAAIANYLPLPNDLAAGHVVVTTRNADFGQLGKPFAVRVLRRDRSAELLRKRANRLTDDGAEELAKALGDLPLALEQAAAVCGEANLSFSQYLRRFETHWAELLSRGERDLAHPSSLVMTLEFSFGQMDEEHPLAAQMLMLASYLHGDGVEQSMLAEANERGAMPQPLGNQCADPVSFGELGRGLRRFSLADVDGELLSTHRLVAALSRQRIGPAERAKWASTAAFVAQATFHYDSHDPATWASCGRRVRHVLEAAGHADKAGVALDSVADLYNDAGRFLYKMNRLAEARSALEKALSIVTRRQGTGGSKHAAVSNNLGRVLQAQGDAQSALTYFEQSLQIDQGNHGEATPKQAAAANNYAKQLQLTGQTEEALGHFRWVVQTLEAEHPDGHAKLAAALNNLGYCLLAGGQLDDAATQLGRAWQIADDRCPATDPTRATILRNFAHLKHQQGDVPGAKDYAGQARVILADAYGTEDHPEIAMTDALLRQIG